MAKKYYAVKNGRVPGIYNTWEECQKQVNGYSKPVFKGFSSLSDARAFLGEDTVCISVCTENADCKYTYDENAESDETDIIETDKTHAVAYVDGSYDVKTASYSYGMVIFHDGQRLKFSKKYENDKYAEMRNVAGEIKGAEAAMQYCMDNDIRHLTIYYDYAGIEKWCTGVWQTTKEGTAAYAEFYKDASKTVDVKFVKVKGHSGDKYNDMADELAKGALGLK